MDTTDFKIDAFKRFYYKWKENGTCPFDSLNECLDSFLLITAGSETSSKTYEINYNEGKCEND